ncbi:testis-specific serine/threonine-protein kinase 1-like [Limulus polyphemus]|uniref:Testis-specific serine/threonine-protein kinase 1-like n=1 Tax=Limulus polyphemus TaxID=6850 RepID=A0ABM1BA46_LIMPO|nr:testis-specific serine/threonine-protein kinase 1-like [Limulus polyphemus]
MAKTPKQVGCVSSSNADTVFYVGNFNSAYKELQSPKNIVKTLLRGRSSNERLLNIKGYTVGTQIGCGTFASVKLAYCTAEDQLEELAVKIVARDRAPKEFTNKFFPRELEILKKLDHSNIIKLHAIYHLPEKTYIFMELARKGDVIEYIQVNGPSSEQLAKRWFHQIIRALRYCHRLEIAHRDLKCENILLDDSLNAKLTDFGFSRTCFDPTTNRRILSETYCGSAAYVAPEVVRAVPYNPMLSDLWSLGICLFVILNNSMPFDDFNLNKMLRDQEKRNWRLRSNIEPTLSNDVKQLLRKLLEPDVMKRIPLDQIFGHSWLQT